MLSQVGDFLQHSQSLSGLVGSLLLLLWCDTFRSSLGQPRGYHVADRVGLMPGPHNSLPVEDWQKGLPNVGTFAGPDASTSAQQVQVSS